MFENITQSYTLQDASSEILILLIGAFLLGILMGWLMWGYEEKKPDNDETVIELPPRNITIETDNVIIELPPAIPKPKPAVVPGRRDDLKIVEGIGPKVEQFLYSQGILTWKDLSSRSIYDLKDLLLTAGEDYALHDPTAWPEQARLAHADLWHELMQMQSKLRSGK
jgi:predicted flap endonuclease-1-like 5' DNA nuclease